MKKKTYDVHFIFVGEDKPVSVTINNLELLTSQCSDTLIQLTDVNTGIIFMMYNNKIIRMEITQGVTND